MLTMSSTLQPLRLVLIISGIVVSKPEQRSQHLEPGVGHRGQQGQAARVSAGIEVLLHYVPVGWGAHYAVHHDPVRAGE